MPDNPFKPPSAEVRDQPPGRGSAVKGIALGALVDVGGTLVFGLLLGMAYAMVLVAQGQNEQEIQAALANVEANAWMSGIGVVGGCAFSILGGYVCERIARRGTYRLGVVLAGLLAVLGLVVSWSSYSIPMHGLLIVLTAGSALLGTRLGWERRDP